MMHELRVLVIIPAFNEEANILDTVSSVEEAGYDYVVINDGSTDDTLRVCRDAGVNVLDLPQNLGIGGAVQAGHKYAKRFGYDVDIQVDGDGQHDAHYISRLLDEINNGSDLVIGSRFLEESEGFKSTFLRRLGIRWLSAVIHLTTHVRVSDPTSGFRACGSKAIDLFCKKYPVDYPEPDSAVAAMVKGLRVTEVPVVMKERQRGKSSISGFSSIYYMIKVTLAIIISSFSN